jgi:hypothetical protein
MRMTYLPAIWPSAMSSRWTTRPMNTLDPRLQGTDAYHPYALASYADPSWRRQRFEWEPEDRIFGDSGGYSAATRGLLFDARAVVQWQINHCDVGAVLDLPPWQDWDQWKASLRQTAANVKAAVPVYRRALDNGTPFRWWGVVHGRKGPQCQRREVGRLKGLLASP